MTEMRRARHLCIPMPKKKRETIAERPKLPTVKEYFTELAERQLQQITELKNRLFEAKDESERAEVSRKAELDAWRLHPLVKVEKQQAARKKTAKAAKKKPAAKRVVVKKASAKAAKKKSKAKR